MPFVVKNESGEYLRRYPHRSPTPGKGRRAWVTELDQATIWEKKGHAKAAASQALLSASRSKEDKQVKAAAIQEVRLMLWGSAEAHKPKR